MVQPPNDRTAPEPAAGAILGALIVPSAPHLLPAYAGRRDHGAQLRNRVVAALAQTITLVRPERIVVVTGADRSPRHSLGPVGVRLAAVVLPAAGWTGRPAVVALPFDASSAEVGVAIAEVLAHPGRSLLLVPADGTAKRTEKAPGHLDERAWAIDDEIVRALAEGDARALLALDPSLCEELWCTGRAALQVLAGCFPGGVSGADLLWADDPYGVQYLLARWRSTPSAPGWEHETPCGADGLRSPREMLVGRDE